MDMRVRKVALPSTDHYISRIYGLLFEDPSFHECVRETGELLRAHIMGLHEEDIDLGRGRMELFGALSGQEMLRISYEYQTDWNGKNLWVARSAAGLDGQGFQHGEAVVADRELLASDYYRHFLSRIDIRHGMGIALQRHGGQRFTLASINRPRQTGPFDANELTFVQRIQPHLSAAYRLSQKIGGLLQELGSLRMGFDNAPFGALVLDAGCHVVTMNNEASQLIQSHAGLSLGSEGLLRAANVEQSAWLRNTVAMLSVSPAHAFPVSGLIGNLNHERPLIAVLHPSPDPIGTLFHPRGRVFAFLYDIDREGGEAMAARIVQQLFGLTPAEARTVLAVRRHQDPEKAAQHLCLSPETIRTHLKHAARKAGTHKQAELTRIADRVLACALRHSSSAAGESAATYPIRVKKA